MTQDTEREIHVPASAVVESQTLALLNKSEIDQQIATAHRYPRSIKRFIEEATALVTLNDQVAQECIYALPRDGKTIEGPSARMAEIIASCWGNSRAGARVVAEDGEFVTAQGAFHDLERNVAITYEVKRRIVDRQGRRYKPDMIGVTANAACSIALRNAILKGVPKAFWSSMYDAARHVIMGDAKTLTNRRADALAYLQKLGATQEMVLNLLGVPGVEEITPEMLVTLRGIATAIRDGDTTVEQAFAGSDAAPAEPGDGDAGANDIAERLQGNGKNGEPAETASSKPQETAPDVKQTEEPAAETPPPDPSSQGFTMAELLKLAEAADSMTAIEEIRELNEKHLKGQEKANVTKVLSRRLDALLVAAESA